MTVNFDQVLLNGGGRIEYLYMIQGLPWCCTTSAEVDWDTELTNDQKQTIGGGVSATPDSGTEQWPARSAFPFFPVLKYPGKQQIKLDGENIMLQGGSWDIEILNEPLGYDWPHRDGDIDGLEGLATIPDPRFDPTINEARLSRNFRKADTHIYMKYDIGDGLYDKINTNVGLDELTYLWIGNECLLATDRDTTGCDTGEFRAEITGRGYRSKHQSSWLDDFDGSSIIISDAPTGGAGGRPASLWAVVVDENNTVISEPVLFRNGKVTSNINITDAKIRVKHLGWNEWLNADFKGIVERNKKYSMQMSGYLFTRPSNTAIGTGLGDCAPHIIIVEWTGAAYGFKSLWLCDEQDSVYFDTYEDLLNEVTDILEDALLGAPPQWGNSSLTRYYKIASGDLVCINPASEKINLVAGPVPWLLCMGAYPRVEHEKWWEVLKNNPEKILSYSSYRDDFDTVNGLYSDPNDIQTRLLAVNPWMSIYDTKHNALGNQQVISDVDIFWSKKEMYGMLDSKEKSLDKLRSPYVVQYDWTNDDNADPATTDPVTTETKLQGFPWPPDHDTGDALMHLDNTVEMDDFTANVFMHLGRPSKSEDKESDEKVPSHLVFDADSFDTTEKTITVGTHFTFELSSDPAAVNVDQDRIGPCTKGWILFHIPFHRKHDPWKVTQALNVQVEDALSISNLFKALFGDTSEFILPERYVLDHVPDMLAETIGTNVEQYNTIDWNQLSDLLQSDIQAVTKYDINLANEFNFKDMFKAFLSTHGIGMTYYYYAFDEHFKIGFRKLGLPNISDARNAGRIIDNDNRVAGKTPILKRATSDQYNQLSWQGNYNGKKFLGEINVINEGGYATLGGRKATWKIKDKATTIRGLSGVENNDFLKQLIYSHFNDNLLKQYAYPNPTISADLIMSSLLNIAVGEPCLITDITVTNPYTNELGVTNQPGLCIGMSLDLGKGKGVNRANIQLAPGGLYGWCPALELAANTTTITVPGVGGTITVGSLATDPANNVFANVNGSRTDLAFFDCYVSNLSMTATTASDCGCGDYGVIAWQGDITDLTGQIFQFTIENVNLAAGTCTLEGDNAGWDVTKKYYVTFDDWDSGNLEDCQKWYVWFATKNGQLDDGATVTKGMRWL